MAERPDRGAHPWRPSQLSRSPKSSEYFVDLVHGSVRTSFPDADGHDVIQERVLLGRGLEFGQRSEVIARRIDDGSEVERGDDIGRAVAQPLESHVYQLVIVGLERDAQIELLNAVGAQQEPIAAAGQNRATKSRAFEIASRDR